MRDKGERELTLPIPIYEEIPIYVWNKGKPKKKKTENKTGKREYEDILGCLAQAINVNTADTDKNTLRRT